MSQAQQEGRAQSFRFVHPILVGATVTLGAAMGLAFFIGAAFGNLWLLSAIPLIVLCLVLILAWFARVLLGRSFWIVNSGIVVLSVAFAVTLYSGGVPAVVFNGGDVGPLVVGALGGGMSLALHPRALRLIGIAGFGVSIVAVGLPMVEGAIERAEAAAAVEEAALQRVIDASIRPYIAPGLVVRSALLGSEKAWINLSSDPDAKPDTDLFADPGDVTILTAALWTQDKLEEQASDWPSILTSAAAGLTRASRWETRLGRL